METGLMDSITSGGGIGLSALLIWVVWKLVTNHDAHLLDALNRNTTAWIENAKVMQQLVDRLGERK